jgi:hypothetical protein
MIHEQLNMEELWDGANWEKPKYREENVSQCHFVCHKSKAFRPGIETVFTKGAKSMVTRVKQKCLPPSQKTVTRDVTCA